MPSVFTVGNVTKAAVSFPRIPSSAVQRIEAPNIMPHTVQAILDFPDEVSEASPESEESDSEFEEGGHFIAMPVAGDASITTELEASDSNLVTSIKEKYLLQPKKLTMLSSSIVCSIHRVPHCFRRHHENAYDPQIVSIGPFHYQKRKGQLQTIEEHKWRYLREILQQNGEDHLERCLVAIRKLEEKARRCYSEEVELESNPFIEMMVLDGCFIIEFFRKALDREYCDDPIFKLGWLKSTITMDLLMLENQIPFFILEAMCYEMGFDGDSLMKWIFSFFGFSTSKKVDKFHHLLHLLHRLHLPSLSGKRPTIRKLETIPSASRLQEAGIKFKKGSGLSDIKFQKGVIEVPPLKVKDTTNSIFLNLVAFEQCYRHCNSYFAGYTYFMDCLIDNAKDVQILCENGIIDPWLSSNQEVAALFNKMGREIIVYDYDSNLQNVCKEINQYYGTSWNEWRASLMRNYFNNPWATISVFAAIILLVFTCFQTFFAVFPKFAYSK